MRWTALGLAAGLSLASACSSSSSTAPPQPQPLNLTGTWSGDLVLQGTTARMTWALTQTNSAVTGSALISLPSGTVLLNGALSGTLSGLSGLSGSTLAYTIVVSPGGIPTRPTCSGELGGNVAATTGVTSTLTGSYAVTTATCTGFSTGSFTLTRQ
jgi:2-keto-4-pentenoate hydratase/2-oxohepta-3-ene-1,7-dioic acid hydratase in catechol pathway